MQRWRGSLLPSHEDRFKFNWIRPDDEPIASQEIQIASLYRTETKQERRFPLNYFLSDSSMAALLNAADTQTLTCQ
jgi:hypothetical protein